MLWCLLVGLRVWLCGAGVTVMYDIVTFFIKLWFVLRVFISGSTTLMGATAIVTQ